MGNSEVGHLNLGAGSVIMQDLTRIDAAAADGELAANEVLRAAFEGSERVHIIGLVSDGGVHSSLDHLHALIDLAAELKVRDLVVHAFTDGRDTLPHAGAGYLEQVESWMGEAGAGGSVRSSGATSRWIATSAGTASSSPTTCSSTAARSTTWRGPPMRRARHYERDETDEFITPTLVGEEARIRPGDSVAGAQLPPRPHARDHPRAGRARLRRFRPRGAEPVARYTTMTEYEEGWPYPVAFPPERPATTLAAVIARPGRAPAARRRDREVRPRHLLLQRRRGVPVRRRAARAGALAARRPDLRLQARDERRRGRPRIRRRLAGGPADASASSTSPTPTWSATPG